MGLAIKRTNNLKASLVGQIENSQFFKNEILPENPLRQYFTNYNSLKQGNSKKVLGNLSIEEGNRDMFDKIFKSKKHKNVDPAGYNISKDHTTTGKANFKLETTFRPLQRPTAGKKYPDHLSCANTNYQ